MGNRKECNNIVWIRTLLRDPFQGPYLPSSQGKLNKGRLQCFRPGFRRFAFYSEPHSWEESG